MNAVGYNAVAENIIADVGGDLNLTSLQNSSHSSNKSNSFNAGYSSAGANGGVSNSRGKEDRDWVDNQTSLIGTKSVDIDVDGKLSMTGSLIANIDENGVDTGNLDVKAGSLEYSDIDNKEESEQKGFSFSQSGINENMFSHPKGSTTIGMTDKSSEKESITHATIGNGNIEIADGSGEGINRDINNAEETIKDLITGALDGSITIDNRFFRGEGRSEILNNIVNVFGNTIAVGANVVAGTYNMIMHSAESIQDIADQVKNSLKSMGDSMKKVFDTIKEMMQGKDEDEVDSALKEEEKTTEEEVNTDEEKIEEGEEGEVESEGEEEADTETEIDEDDNSEEEKKRNITKLAIEAETGCKDGDVECYIKNSNNLNFNYALDPDGNVIVPPISCRDDMSECKYIGKNTPFLPPNELLERYPELNVKLDENGKIVTQRSVAYLSADGKFDVASIGSFQWAAKDGKNGGGLADLLDAAKTGYESFYKDYIKIMGENGNKANINNSDIANNPEKIKQLEELSMKYAKDEDFRKFEQDVAYERYFVKPVSKLPENVRDKVNGLTNEEKSIIFSSFVHGSVSNNEISNLFNTGSIASALYSINNKEKDLGFDNRYKIQKNFLDNYYKGVKNE